MLPGTWQKVKENVKGALDIRKAVRDVLSAINVPFVDSCCSNGTVSNPVRFDADSEQLQYFNGTDWVQVPTSALSV